MLTVSRWLARSVAVVGLVVFAGCGSSEDTPAPPKALDPNDPILLQIDPKKPPKLPSAASQQPPRY